MTDWELQANVEHALACDPCADTTDLGVNVEAGIVTLRGNVTSYSQKARAERVALSLAGVRAVANELRIRFGAAGTPPDNEIALAAANALRWDSQVPDHLSVAVSDGWITLKGHVEWDYQKDAATHAVCDMHGVRGVTNEIVVSPHVSVVDVKSKIEAALKRIAEADARRINVTASDGKVTLSGNVRSWAERDEAWHAAWAAPGVKAVDDRIAVVP